ncbi:protein ROOT INITIATION DEFECTIVE 3-like isoform X2 [Malania oleifera]|uniref:protein ROOT INITIATION DEFECTIVE 3-like isoform X2 n=1 Tax=Malania oleifera TaxID=397392 RepID=UPI0025AE5AD6|nr:protein ROOT INITIATION DEFECTIVE 3-like isoform X2 [Malania oleifera]
MEMGERREGLAVCSDKSMIAGITIWDIETGDRVLHIPTCASPPHGFLCLRNRFFMASQINRHGSLGGGSIVAWPLNKPQAMLRSYPVEAIGPICCTRDGVFLAGGAPSGNVYIWEVTSGRLLKNWHAHNRSLNCMVFSDDDSLLISGSDDGIICVWSMFSLLDAADCGSLPPLLHSSSEHLSSITGVLSTAGSSSSVFISSSLDGTCKIWDLVTGRPLQTQVYPQAITAIVIDPGEQLLFSGSSDGRIFVNKLDIGLAGDPFTVAEDQSTVLNGHNGPVTVLAFSASGLISASEDCTACLWDVVNWVIIRRFNHQKGPITNLVVIPQLSLLSMTNNPKVSNQFRVSPLEKLPSPSNSTKGTVCCSLKDHRTIVDCRSAETLNRQILDLEKGQTPAVMQMEVETSVENRMWATRMTKHVMEMNRHLQSRLLDLMQSRLLLPPNIDSLTARKRKKLKIESSPMGEEHTQPPC